MMTLTDAQLQTNVTDELRFEPSLNAQNITSSVRNGVVTLMGTVANYPEKWAAERAIKRVLGVRGVAEELTVHFTPDITFSDAEIAGAARRALEWSAAIPEKDIQIRVEKAWITLEGTVDWQTQRQNAHDLVSNLLGVKGVSNMITLRPHASLTVIHSGIEAAFKRSSELEASRVQVEVNGGHVTLRGTLPTWTEINAAALAAWNAAGVTEVDNQVHIGA
ncbi:BON domain-containing protein [Deinococcus sp. A31D244]|uniref:BON domain-containing protein n=1 Tax=Deinococcus sp. A31D244 TaxID=3397675 RepID=UPI0039DFC9EC